MRKPWWIIAALTLMAGVCFGLIFVFASPAWAPPAVPTAHAESAPAAPAEPAPASVASGMPPSMPPAGPVGAVDGAMGRGEEAAAGGDNFILGGGYVGSAKCAECHNKPDTAIYDRFMKFSRKSHSLDSVKRMKGLDAKEREGCYRCHTTGYGKPTGFVSPEKTPQLADVGCEACHGPGKLHTQTMDMAHIVRKVTIDVCAKCHNDAKVKSFRFKGVIYAGAH